MKMSLKGRALGRVARLTIALLAVVGGGVVIAAPPAAADDGFPGTFVLWLQGRAGECMVPNSLTAGSKVVTWSGCTGGNYPDMLWQSLPLSNGAYELRNDANDSLCLAVPSNSWKATAIVATCNGDLRQQWYEVTNADQPDWGDRMLQNRSSGYCLNTENASTLSDPVIQWYCMSQFRDLWWYFGGIR
jgi:hypothetical protein